ncbi:class I SAM-dependent DNA methyltransferase, partial [Streptomyces sp. NPDC059627]
MQDNATEVTAAGIARLAGVGRAAVSNWRRRHADFPKPVGGTETSPSFALAEVESWLRKQGKLAEVPLRERVWQQLAGHPEGALTALVHTGCVLLLIHERPTVWLDVSAGSDERLAAMLPGALEQVLTARLGGAAERTVHSGRTARTAETVNRPGDAGSVNTAAPSSPVNTGPTPPVATVAPATPGAGASTTPGVRTPTGPQLLPSTPLLRGAAELAAEVGARQAFEFLLGRHLDANPRQYTLTPSELAGLMADLAGPARTVLDPACGTGALLRAVDVRPGQELYAQDSAPDLAALTALRLALHSRAGVHGATGDTLRADAHPELRADAVLCHPPFNERNWGHDELAYDARWEYGFPARTESELAWVQHALARLADGGTAVLLMPPAVASRRSGRRIRADLLRRGALRALVALPVGAAAPYSIPLHLWVLRRPDRTPAAPEVLLVDTGRFAAEGRGGPDWAAVRDAALDAWRAFERAGGPVERPGLARSV